MSTMTCFVHISQCPRAQVPCLSRYLSHVSLCAVPVGPAGVNIPLLITFLSTHHSPSTVNMNASEFVMGTVKLNSAFPINMKNHTLPVTFSSSGMA